jgi:hypothetical protein
MKSKHTIFNLLVFFLLFVSMASFVVADVTGVTSQWSSPSSANPLEIVEGSFAPTVTAQVYVNGAGQYDIIIDLTNLFGIPIPSFNTIDLDNVNLPIPFGINTHSVTIPQSITSNLSPGSYFLTSSVFDAVSPDYSSVRLIVLPDNDGDGIPNADDNCPDDQNSGQDDSDGDGDGDVCDDPEVVSPATPGTAFEGSLFSSNIIEFNDPNNEGLTISIASIDAVSSLGTSVSPNLIGGVSLQTVVPGESVRVQLTPDFTFLTHPDLIDSFNVVVQADDGDETISTTLTVTVNDMDRDVTISSIPTQSATEGSFFSLNVGSFTNDNDSEDQISYSLLSSPTGMSISSSTGVISWSPGFGAFDDGPSYPVTVGADSFSGDFETESFTINVANVNRNPIITSSAPTSATEASLYTYTVVATDPDTVFGDSLLYSLLLSPTGMSINPTSGVISWTPDFDAFDLMPSGGYPITVDVTDTFGGSDTQSWTITVANVNRVPNITSSPLLTANEGISYSYNAVATDADVAFGDSLIYTLLAAPIGMTINPTSGQIDWSPGFDSFDNGPNYPVTVVVTDTFGGSDSQSWTITVANVNRNPTITSSPVLSAVEGSIYEYDVIATDADLPFGDFLAYSLTTRPTGMTINSGNGEINWNVPFDAFENGPNHPVTVVVTDNFGGSDTQTYSISIVDVPNTAPVIATQADVTAPEGSITTISLSATDADTANTVIMNLNAATTTLLASSYPWITITSNVPGNPASVVLEVNPPYDAAPDIIPITIEAVDNGIPTANAIPQSFNIIIIDTNQPPVFTSSPGELATETLLYTYLPTVIDPDSTLFTYSFGAEFPTGMTIDPVTGLVEWTPELDDFDNGPSHNVQIIVNDNDGNIVGQDWKINVSNTNQAPTITSLTPLDTATEGLLYIENITAFDADVAIAGDELTFSLIQNPPGMTIDPITGDIEWLVDFNAFENGPVYSAEVQVEDLFGEIDTLLYTITINNTNQPPHIDPADPIPSPQNATEGIGYSYTIPGVDDDGDVITYTLINGPSGFVVDALSGVASWTPNFTAADLQPIGGYPIVVEMSDSVDTALVGWEMVVTEVNQIPQIISLPVIEASETLLYSYDVDAIDADASDILFYSLLDSPTGMTIDSATGLIEWTPDFFAFESGPNYTVEVLVHDLNGGEDTQSWIIAVSNLNVAPIVTFESPQDAEEGSTYSQTITAFDPDNDPFTIRLAGGPIGPDVHFVDNADGSWTFSWNIGYSEGSASGESYLFAFEADDGISAPVNFTIEVVVFDVNTVPQIISVPDTTAFINVDYEYQIVAIDEDGDDLDYLLVEGPEGLELNDDGLVYWSTRTRGSFDVTVGVTDGVHTVTQSWTIQSDYPKKNLKFSHISFNNEIVSPGEFAWLAISVENDGDIDFSGTKASVIVYGMNLKTTGQTFTIESGEQRSQGVGFVVPRNTMPGIYDVRLVVSNDEYKHVAHRVLRVI